MSELSGHTIYYGGMPDSRQFVTIEVEPPLDDEMAEATKHYMEAAMSTTGTGNIAKAVYLTQRERTRLFIEVGKSGGLTPKGFASVAATAIRAIYGGRTYLAEMEVADDFPDAEE